VANNPGALSFADPFANVSDAAVSVGGVDLHAPTQYLQSWNLTGERQLSPDTAVEASYPGSKGTHLGSPQTSTVPIILLAGIPAAQWIVPAAVSAVHERH
jgi:hypothetical protein